MDLKIDAQEKKVMGLNWSETALCMQASVISQGILPTTSLVWFQPSLGYLEAVFLF